MIRFIYTDEEEGGDVRIEYEIEDSSMLEYLLEHVERFLRSVGFILDGNLKVLDEDAVLEAYREGWRECEQQQKMEEDDGK